MDSKKTNQKTNIPFYCSVNYSDSCYLIIVLVYKNRKEKSLRLKAQYLHEKALQASKAKSDFLAYTSHELRTPLNGIIVGSEVIKNKSFGEENSKYTEYAAEIHKSGHDLLEFIDDLLDELKTEQGGFDVNENNVVNLNEIIKRALNLNISRAAQQGINIIIKGDNKLPKVKSDPKRIRQILNNLISNAVKYSPSGTNVTISSGYKRKKIYLSVQDEGFGMSKENLKVAFTEFGTIENANSGVVDSVGLGLPLVKKLTEKLGIELDVKSEENKGTKMTLIFSKEKIYFAGYKAKQKQENKSPDNL